MQKLPKFAVTMLALACTVGQAWADEPAPMPFSELAAKCAPTVHQQTLKSLIGNESTYNPYAIGVVGEAAGASAPVVARGGGHR